MGEVWQVYIALLEDGRFYIGMTHVRPEERVRRHQAGLGGVFTRGVGIVRVLWSEPHDTLESARKREQQLKNWTHAKMQALIDGDMKRLKALACSRRRGSHGRP